MKSVHNDAFWISRSPKLSLSSCDLDRWHLQSSCRGTVARIYRSMCLPGLVNMCRTVLKMSAWLNRIFVTYFGTLWPWPLTSWSLKLTVWFSWPVDCLCQFAAKSVYSLSKYTYRVDEFYLRQRRRLICLPVFVCLSVCLLARLLKNACMDLDEMLRVVRCRDMDELTNFWAWSGL